MKRLAIAMLALVIALPLFAGELDNAVFSLSGSARTTWGIDLVSMATGFQNTLAAKLRLDFKPATTQKKSGSEEATVYGEIAFKDIYLKTKEVSNAEDKDADIEMRIKLDYAKIIGPNWWISVKEHDDSIDYENATQNGIIGVAAAWDNQMDRASSDISGVGGFEAGYTVPDIVGVELSLFSLADTAIEDVAEWFATVEQNAYGFKIEASVLAVENLTAKAAFNMGFGNDAAGTLVDEVQPGFGGLVNYKLMLGETMYLKPEIGVDVKTLNGGGMNMAIGNGLLFFPGGAEVTMAEDGIRDDVETTKTWAWDDGVNAGLTLGWDLFLGALGTAAPADPVLGLQAHYGFSMVENLMVAVGFEAADILNNGNMGFAVYGQYDAGVVVPHAGMFMRLDNEANGGADGVMVVDAGLKVPNFVPLTSLYVDYNSGNLLADDVGDEADLGVLKVGVEVAY